MIRIQLYLPKQLYKTIDLVARRENKPKAQVIRDMLEKGITKKANTGTTFLKLAKNPIKGLPKDLSNNIDKYLYEDI